MEKKMFIKGKIKAVGDNGTFTGYANVFNVIDSYGDMVIAGAFKKTINDNNGEFPLLWFHNPGEPIGTVKVEEDEKGLKITEGRIDLETQKGREVYSGMKKGYITHFSIGYNIVKADFKEVNGQQVYVLQEIKLMEVSALTKGMAANLESQLEEVKANDKIIELEKKINEISIKLNELEKKLKPEPEETTPEENKKSNEPDISHSLQKLLNQIKSIKGGK